MSANNKILSALLIGILLGILGMFLFSGKSTPASESIRSKPSTSVQEGFKKTLSDRESIEALTEQNRVISYVKAHHELPGYYLTKSQAKKQGWNPSSGNLCDVLPGRAIGGDRFSNREKALPASGNYYEADVNCHCGRRGKDRIVFTKDGEVWLSLDHYKTFEKQ